MARKSTFDPSNDAADIRAWARKRRIKVAETGPLSATVIDAYADHTGMRPKASPGRVTAKKAPVRKAAAKKTTARKTSARKPAAKKTAGRKPARKATKGRTK